MKKKIRERIKSPVVWMAVIAQIVLLIALFNQEASATFKQIATIIIEILTIFGILNNPADGENF